MSTPKDPCGRHTNGDGSWWATDARGIEVARVCDRCERAKTAHMRRDVMTNSNYDCDEAVEPEDY